MTRAWALAASLAALAAAPAALPTPSLDRVEPGVREHLGRQRALLDAALAAGDAAPPALALLYGETGLLYLAYHFREAALACLLRAEALAPEDLRWPYYAGIAHQEDGDLDPAAAAFGRARRRDPAYPALGVRQGQVALARNRLTEAEAAFERAVAHAGTAAAAWFGLGRVAAARGRTAEALTHFQAALALAPQASAVHYPLALAYRAAGDLEAARRHLAQRGDVDVAFADPLVRRLEESRRGAAAALERASRAALAGRHAEAAAAYRAALAESPGDPRALGGLAAALLAGGDADGALDAYRELLARDPGDAAAQLHAGSLLLQRGQAAAALEHLLAATRAAPEAAAAHVRLGSALAMLGRFAEAAAAFERGVALAPDDVAAQQARVQAWLRAGDEEEAWAALEEGLARAPDDAGLRHLRARLLATAARDGRRDGARALAEAQRLFAASRDPAHAETLAMALAEVGRFAEAQALQAEVVEALDAEPAPEARRAAARRRLDLYRQQRPCRSPWSQ